MEAKESTSFKVLILPWLAHGHISPYFELAKKLAKKDFQIFFCSTAINLSSTKKSFNENLAEFSIEFIDIHLPVLPDLPPQYHTTKGLPTNLVDTLIHAFHMSKTSFSDIINHLKPNLLIYDSYQPWAAECASLQKIPSIHFYTSGAATMSYFQHMSRYGFSRSSLNSYPFPEIFITDNDWKKIQAMAASNPQSSGSNHFAFTSFQLSNEIVLIKTSRGIEGKYLDYLSSLSGKKLVPVGSLVQEPMHVEEDHLHIFNWLNTKNPSSVMFVSFGSECFLSKEEMGEMAHGLELSDVNFIWVVRFPAGGDTIKISEAVTERFLERTKDRGIVVEGWAPQTKILQHPSTGGFVSHCGWSSVIETLYYGVPLIAMPIKLDQPTNGRLLVDLGVGKEVLRDENGEWKSEEIAKVIQEIVVRETGDDVKRKARELSQNLRMEEEELIDQAIEKLKMICFSNMHQQTLKKNQKLLRLQLRFNP